MGDRAWAIVFSPILVPLRIAEWIGRFGAGDGPRRVGRCPGCGTTVFDDDPHLRYRGDVFHAEPCVEIRAQARPRATRP